MHSDLKQIHDVWARAHHEVKSFISSELIKSKATTTLLQTLALYDSKANMIIHNAQFLLTVKTVPGANTNAIKAAAFSKSASNSPTGTTSSPVKGATTKTTTTTASASTSPRTGKLKLKQESKFVSPKLLPSQKKTPKQANKRRQSLDAVASPPAAANANANAAAQRQSVSSTSPADGSVPILHLDLTKSPDSKSSSPPPRTSPIASSSSPGDTDDDMPPAGVPSLVRAQTTGVVEEKAQQQRKKLRVPRRIEEKLNGNPRVSELLGILFADMIDSNTVKTVITARNTYANSLVRMYNLFNNLLETVSSFEPVHDLIWLFLNSFQSRDDKGTVEHYFVRINGCATHFYSEVESSFRSLYSTLAGILSHPNLPLHTASLIFRAWSITFVEEDRSFLHESRIFPILRRYMSTEGREPEPQQQQRQQQQQQAVAAEKSPEKKKQPDEAKAKDAAALAPAAPAAAPAAPAPAVGNNETWWTWRSYQQKIEEEKAAAGKASPSAAAASAAVTAASSIGAVTSFTNIVSFAQIQGSSNNARARFLTDRTTLTFWESNSNEGGGSYDSKKSEHSLMLTFPDTAALTAVSLFIDATADPGFIPVRVRLDVGLQQQKLHPIAEVAVSPNQVGFLSIACQTVHAARYAKITLFANQGAGQWDVRVRQLYVLGVDIPDKQITMSAHDLVARDAIKTFNVLAKQCFLTISGVGFMNDSKQSWLEATQKMIKHQLSTDLRQQVIGVMYSDTQEDEQLKEVQMMVFELLFIELKRETKRAAKARDWLSRDKESWELGSHWNSEEERKQSDARSDAYFYELSSMVLSLSGSAVGRRLLLSSPSFFTNLFLLLTVGTPRIQRNAIQVCFRILPSISPSFLEMHLPTAPQEPAQKPASPKAAAATALKSAPTTTATTAAATAAQSAAPSLPVKDAVVPDTAQPKGLLAVRFLFMCLANSLQLQIRGFANGKRVLKQERLPARLGVDGLLCTDTANRLLRLLKSLSQLKEWGDAMERLVKDVNSYIPSLSNESAAVIGEKPEAWLVIAALYFVGVTGKFQDLLSEQAATKDAPIAAPTTATATATATTTATPATTGAKAAAAKAPEAKAKEKLTIVFENTDDQPRLKLFEGPADKQELKMLIGVYPKNSQAKFEIRQKGSNKCRFCSKPLVEGKIQKPDASRPALNDVCTDSDCVDKMKISCGRFLACGHACGGVKEEKQCLPCLVRGCGDTKLDGDDFCSICGTENMFEAPSIQLTSCGHVFHENCVRTIIKNGYSGGRITFGFLNCPLCKKQMNHPAVKDVLDPFMSLLNQVREKCKMRVEYEGLMKTPALLDKASRFYNDPIGYGMHHFAYYLCYKCKKPYYGGEYQCAAAAVHEFDPSELICGGCSPLAVPDCPKHGKEYIEFKCRFCCAIAIWFCFGTTHFCEPCHNNNGPLCSAKKEALVQCPCSCKDNHAMPAALPKGTPCPLRIDHPKHGEEYAIGCGICRNVSNF